MQERQDRSPVAIVTAASRGIGAAVGLELASRGYRLVVLARGEDVAPLTERLEAVGSPEALSVRGSVTDPEALEEAVEAARARWGAIDAVVNNTGHASKGSLLSIPDADWHDGLDLLLLNVARIARLVVPAMEAGSGGAFVNISTFGAREPDTRFPVSSVVRAGLTAFTKIFAREYAPHGIRMNNLLPGFVDSYETDQATVDAIPAGRPATVEEVAKVAAFLVSSEASYLTGQDVLVDGGLVRGI